MAKIFRGVGIEDGEVYEGYYFAEDGDYYIRNYAGDNEVFPDSVKQLVGYDKTGCKVFEGDIVTDRHGERYTVSLKPCFDIAFNRLEDFELET